MPKVALLPRERDHADLKAIRQAVIPESARQLDHLLG